MAIFGYWTIAAVIALTAVSVAFALSIPVARSTESDAVLCVSPEGSAGASGHCWDDPLDLHTALRQAEPGEEIWIQQGTYSPGDSPHATFYMPEGVDIYGGFSGSSESPARRDPDPALTVLDGQNLNYTVVVAAGISHGMLNGVAIKNGAATVIENDAIDLYRRGGGIYVSNSSPTFQNLLIANNRARFGGGGAYIDEGSSPVFRNVVFQSNSLTHPHSGRGGGLRVLTGEVTLTDVTFRYNEAIRGGGVYVDEGSVTIERSVFGENRSENQGGALALARGSLDITDSRVVFNESGTEGGGLLIGRGAAEVSLAGVEIVGNTSTNSGGGIEILGGEASIVQSEFAANESGEFGGGGIAAREATLDIRNTLIQGNSSLRGGGVLLENAESRIINSVLSGNLASTSNGRAAAIAEQPAEGMPYGPLRRSITGEMIQLPDEDDEEQPPEAGGGMMVLGTGTVDLINTTVTGNRSDHPGAGIYRTGDNTIEFLNSILYGNLATEADAGESHPALLEVFSTNETEFTTRVIIERSIVAGGCAGLFEFACWGAIDQDPLFRLSLDPAAAPISGGNFTPWFTSPAIDAADGSYLPDDIEHDLLGNPRYVTKLAEPVTPWLDARLDIGAVETPRRDASPEREVVVNHRDGEERVQIDVSSDRDGGVEGTIRIEASNWRFEDVLPGKIDWSSQQVTLDGQATLDSGHLVGFRIDLRLTGARREFSQYRVRLDTGSDSGWRAVNPD